MLGNRQQPHQRGCSGSLQSPRKGALGFHSASQQPLPSLVLFLLQWLFPGMSFLPSPEHPFPAPALTSLSSWKDAKENWQMAPALKTCLPLLVAFCGPWSPLSCRSNSEGNRTQFWVLTQALALQFVLRAQQNSEQTVSPKSDGGHLSYLIPLGGGQSNKPALRLQREEEKTRFLALLLIFP